MGFVEEAKKIKGAMMNGPAERVVEAIALLNEMCNYMDLVGVFPSDHDSRDCWTLVFIGEGGEGIITVDVGTHEGVFYINDPEVQVPGEETVESARAGFAALRAEYERVWRERPEKARRVARFLDSLAGRQRNVCPDCGRAPTNPEAAPLPAFMRQPTSPTVDHAWSAAKAGDPHWRAHRG